MRELPALLIFSVVVVGLLVVDLRWIHRHTRVIPFREAVFWSAVWIVLSLGFALGIHFWHGFDQALEFLAAYILEKSLSLDNIFFFAVVFTAMKVEESHQHKVLFWGVLGAIVARAVFIFAGLALISRFAWVHYLFGGLLVVTGVRALRKKKTAPSIEHNPLLRMARKFFPITRNYAGSSFFVKIEGRLFATPLFLVLLLLEMTDVLFALDSIPAVFAVTSDPFIAYTSNILAILGLRAMYFMLASTIPRFRYLHLGLSCVLIFVGAKMLGSGFFRLNIIVTLGVICGVLVSVILASLQAEKKAKEKPA